MRCLFIASVLLLSPLPALADVRQVRIPEGGRVPTVIEDDHGTWHLAYGTESADAYYAQSRDQGKTWSSPVWLNRRAGTVTIGMERGPRLALGKDGSLHALWAGDYRKGGGAWYTRSTDGGKSFEPERRLNEPAYGLDNLALATDGRSLVIAFWTGGFPGHKEDKDSPTASPIILARSNDDGQTFAANQLLHSDHPASSFACGCCRLEAHIVGDRLYIAFRGGYKNLRDPYFLAGAKDGNDFHCVKISDDRWDTTCPMQGIPFRADVKGVVTVAWMSRGEAFWSHSSSEAKSFGERNMVRAKEEARYPLALPLPDGNTYMQWQGRDGVHWRIYHPLNRPILSGGDIRVSGRDKATAFVGRDGNVYVAH